VITRFRIESSEETHDKVERELLDMAASIRDMVGGEWKLEHDLDVQSTKSGFWGRLTLTRQP
jgi:hypothetical protein